jgi:mitochondrial intermembrane space import and assembly protein 40
VKGVDCIDKFKLMQDCFRKYPEHYKEELEDEDEFERSEQEKESREGGEKKSNSSTEDEDEGVREWRAEIEKEGKNSK